MEAAYEPPIIDYSHQQTGGAGVRANSSRRRDASTPRVHSFYMLLALNNIQGTQPQKKQILGADAYGSTRAACLGHQRARVLVVTHSRRRYSEDLLQNEARDALGAKRGSRQDQNVLFRRVVC